MSRQFRSKFLLGTACLLILTAWVPAAGTQSVETPSDTNPWQIIHAAFHKYGMSPYPDFFPGHSAAPAAESLPAAAEPHAQSAQHRAAAAEAPGGVLQCTTTGQCAGLDGQEQQMQADVLGAAESVAVDSLPQPTELQEPHLPAVPPAPTDTATAAASEDPTPLAQAAASTRDPAFADKATGAVPEQLPTPTVQQPGSQAGMVQPHTPAHHAIPIAASTPPSATPAAGSAAAQQRHHRPPPVRRLLNLAELSDGASVVAANPEARKPERAIDRDIDSFMKNDCDAEKWMIIELSQLGTVETVKLTMKELYSSRVHTFRVLGRSSHPRKDGPDLTPDLSTGAWHLMGSFTAENKRGTQSFSLPQRSRVRYLLLMFDTHYGNEQICAMNWIEVLGVSAAQELEEALALQELEAEHEEQHTEQQQQQQASRHIQPLPLPSQQQQQQGQYSGVKALPGPTDPDSLQDEQPLQQQRLGHEELRPQYTHQHMQAPTGVTQAADSRDQPTAGGAAGPSLTQGDTEGATGSSSSAGQGSQASNTQQPQQHQHQSHEQHQQQQQQQGAHVGQQRAGEPAGQQQRPSASTHTQQSGATAAGSAQQQQQQLDSSVSNGHTGSHDSTTDASSGREQVQAQQHAQGSGSQQSIGQGPPYTGTPQTAQSPQGVVTQSQAASQQDEPTRVLSENMAGSSGQGPSDSATAQGGAVPGSAAAAQQPLEPAGQQEPALIAASGQQQRQQQLQEQQQRGSADTTAAAAGATAGSVTAFDATAAAVVAQGSQAAASLGAVPLPVVPLQPQMQQTHQDRAQLNGAGSNGSVHSPQQQQPARVGQTGSSSSSSSSSNGNGNGQQQREAGGSVLDSRGSNKPKQAGNLFDVVKSEMMQLKLDQGKLSKKVDSLTKRSSDFEATAASLQHQQAALSSQVDRLLKKLDALIGTQAAALAQQQQLRKDVSSLLAAQKEQRRGYGRSAGRAGPSAGRMDGFGMGGPDVVIPGVHIPSQPGSSLDTPRKPLLPPVCARPPLEEASLLMQSKYQWSVVTALAGTSLLGLWLVLHPKSATQGFPQLLRLVVCVLALLNGVLAVLLGLWLMVMQSLALHQQSPLIITDPRVSVPMYRMLSNGSAWDTAAL